jgi:glycosyltransferase involved in cell wall biosynthesis
MKKSQMLSRPFNSKTAVFSISAVIPVYNSQGSLPELVRRLDDILTKVTKASEILLVEDGSSDQSWEVIQKLSEDYPRVRGLRLMRNYGQHNALLCGIRAAKYETIVTMDDDLQHYPEEIPALLNKLSEGHDVVYGTPRKLPHSWWRNLLSKYIKWAMARAMGIRNVRDINAFRVFRTEIRKAFTEYRSPDLMLDVLLAWGTTRFATVEIDCEPRRI